MTAYVRDLCPECGNVRAICSDPHRPVYPQRSTCYIAAVRDMTTRQVKKKYGEPDGDDLHPMDGVSIWASPENVNPDDDF